MSHNENRRKGFHIAGLLLSLVVVEACRHTPNRYDAWETYKGTNENIQYSSLTEIDTTNVKLMKPVWEYHAGDIDSVNGSQIQCNPIVINGTLFGTSPKLKVFAIDAATGTRKWEYNPFDSLPANKRTFFNLNNSRGVTYWTDGANDERIFYTAGSNLYCLNAKDGHLVNSFGKEGKLDLHDNLDRDVADLFVTSTTPPVIYNNLLIIGTRVDEGPAAAPGHIRAFDVVTGKMKWIFHTIPHPGEPGYESWKNPDAYKFIGGVNAWSGLTLDKELGYVYAGLGSASYDWYGGKRLGNDLYANSLIALDAATGRLLWHFQTVHHDVWDRDLSSPPALVTIRKNGSTISAVAATSKSGFIFIFDRKNGKPVYDIREQPVPDSSDLAGEELSPTQPIPTAPAPFVRQLFTEHDINPLLPDSSREEIRKRWLSYKHDHMFNPPSFQGTVEFPGLDGGGEWGGPSYDPETGIMYINANEMAWVIQSIKLEATPLKPETIGEAGVRLYRANCMTCHGPERRGSGNFPSLIDVSKKYKPGAFDTLLQTGRRMMPAFKQLRPEDRKAIASFVLELGAEQTKKYVPGLQVDDPTRVPYSIAGYNKFLTSDGLPALSPPWGTLNAINLNTGEYLWRKPLGTDPAFPQAKSPTGTENYGASVVTAGGILFIGASKDGMLRAFNKRTGELLWEYRLPAPAFATPAVFQLNGHQYLVIACGGGKLKTKSGDSYIAFALPQ